MIAAPLLACLALAAPASASVPAGDVQVEAGSITYDAAADRYRLEDGVILRRGAVVLRARSAMVDPGTGEVDAAGDVLLTDATRVLAADGVHAVLGGPFEAEHVTAFLKDRPVDLGGVTTLDAAHATGRNRLTVTGRTVQGAPSGHLQLEGAALTLCDCAPGVAPSWEIRSRHADVVPGRRAILSWPVVRVTPRFLFVKRSIPVLVLPWLYLPLGDRQTGLLAPEVVSSSWTGLRVAEPLFVTLGQSADLTLTPGYAFGGTYVRGPSVRLEGRFAPAQGTESRAELTWLRDLQAEPNGASGDRYALQLQHQERFTDRASLRVDGALYGDPVFARDFTTDVLARGAFYRRSDLLLARRGDDLLLELGAQYLEPLRPGGIPAGERFGTFGADVDVLHRLPFANAILPPVALGPLRLDARAGVARFGETAPLQGSAVPEANPTAPGFAPLARPAGVDLALRPPVTRGDLRAEIGAPLLLAGAVALEPFVRGALVGYAFDQGAGSEASAWAVGGARVSAELRRSFGALTHRVAPSVEWRIGTPPTGAILSSSYDALDRARTRAALLPVSAEPGAAVAPAPLPVLSAAPEGRFHQLRAALRNRLSLAGKDVLDLEVGQDLDLRRGRAAETFFAGAARGGPFSLDASGRLLAFASRPEAVPLPVLPTGVTPPSRILDRFTELHAGAAVTDARGDAVRVGMMAVGRGASGSLLGGLDPLFELRPAPMDAVAQASAGARAVVGPATLGYDVLFPARDVNVPTCDGSGVRRIGAAHIQQQTASFGWDSPFRCFRLLAMVGRNDCAWTTRFVLDLARIGATTPAPSR